MTESEMATLRVLLIDDSRDDRAMARRELARDFPQVEPVEVADGEQFLRAVEAESFDVVVTDHRMHWGDGLEVFRTVKQRRPWCPVVMFTATGTERIAVEAMKQGLDDYVVKTPADSLRLATAVRRALVSARDRRALDEAEARLRHQASLLDALDVGVVTTDAAERVIYCNPAAARLYGERPEDLIGRDGFDVLFPGVLRTEAAGLRATVTSGRAATAELALSGEGAGRRWLHVSARPTSGSSGSFTGVLGIAVDVTAERTAERALRDSEERFRRLVESSLAGVWHVRLDGSTVYLNPAMRHLLEVEQPGDVAGYTYEQFFTADSLDALRREHPTLPGVTTACRAELVGRRGTHRPVVISGAPLFGADGSPCAIVLTVIDLSDDSRRTRARPGAVADGPPIREGDEEERSATGRSPTASV